MHHYKPEAEHLLKKLINSFSIEIKNEELALDIIQDELSELIDEDGIDSSTFGCGHDLRIEDN